MSSLSRLSLRRGELHCVQRHRERCGRQKHRRDQTSDLKSRFNFNVFFLAGLLALAHLKSCVGLLLLGSCMPSALLWMSLVTAKSILFVLTRCWQSVFIITVLRTLAAENAAEHSDESDKPATTATVATRRRRYRPVLHRPRSYCRKHRRYTRSLLQRHSNGLVLPATMMSYQRRLQ